MGRDFRKGDNHIISVIGDGAASAGMAYEALNNTGAIHPNRMLVILNDNGMSIAPAVGALSHHLTRLMSTRGFLSIREVARQMAKKFPEPIQDMAKRADEYARTMLTGGSLFEELGLYHLGPIDGHNLDHLVPILENIRDSKNAGPILLHIITEKGRGHPFPQSNKEKYHAVGKFDVISGTPVKSKSNAPSYTKVYAESLIRETEKDKKICAITGAMPSGTGLDLYGDRFPEHCFDVGIAEQHAVTFAAGLACDGMKPFVTIYSTFLQRGYDQVVHDVAIQKLPVRFAMDRAGLVGQDGPTHAGSFDIAYLGCLPGFVLMACGDEADLKHMVATAAAYNEGPIGFRYPRGAGVGVDMPEEGKPLEIGKGRIIREGSKIAILSYRERELEGMVHDLEALLPRGQKERWRLKKRSLEPLPAAQVLLPRFTEAFLRSLEHLNSADVRRVYIAIAQMILMGQDYPGLHAKNLKGMGGLLSVRAGMHLRLYFLREGDNVDFLHAGSREEQPTYFKKLKE